MKGREGSHWSECFQAGYHWDTLSLMPLENFWWLVWDTPQSHPPGQVRDWGNAYLHSSQPFVESSGGRDKFFNNSRLTDKACFGGQSPQLRKCRCWQLVVSYSEPLWRGLGVWVEPDRICCRYLSEELWSSKGLLLDKEPNSSTTPALLDFLFDFKNKELRKLNF